MIFSAIQPNPITVVIEEKPKNPTKVEYIRKQDALAAIGAWINSPAGERAYQEVENLPSVVLSEVAE